jgi:hypothetical protein
MNPSLGPNVDDRGRTGRQARQRLGAAVFSSLVWALGAGCVIDLNAGDSDAAAGGDAEIESSAGGDAEIESSTGGDTTVSAMPLPGMWVNVTGELAGMPSVCGTVQTVFTNPNENLIAGIADNGLWASSSPNGDPDGGGWSELDMGNAAVCSSAMPPDSECITNRPTALVYDPVNPLQYWESGIYANGYAVYITTDGGNTFTGLGTNTANTPLALGSDLVSVDFSGSDRNTLLAGGHETMGQQALYLSTDGGNTWNNVGASLPAISCTYPLVISPTVYLVGCTKGGVYRTTDGGMHWGIVTSSGGASAPLWASDGSIYWASPTGGGMAKGTSDGATWVDNVTTDPGAITTAHPVELPGGLLATLGPQYVVVSRDNGATWNPASAVYPALSDAGNAVPTGLVYSGGSFYIWYQDCYTFSGNEPVQSDAIFSFPWLSADD